VNELDSENNYRKKLESYWIIFTIVWMLLLEDNN
jgi:hypothetical protein